MVGKSPIGSVYRELKRRLQARAALTDAPSAAKTVCTIPEWSRPAAATFWKHERPHLQAVFEHPVGSKHVQLPAVEADGRSSLGGKQDLALERQAADQVGVERPGEAGVGHRRLKPRRLQHLGGQQA